ncbi:hypothetical protein [Natronolimnohabitans innermongolicus]|uniref:Uncharacterized protein n=1 Tax=Natronolimnohabitans innermongolicus JCM 12255 TaxID=1227499 RepID=L9XLV1_9EURY|nr:hypothetical protein [Natronolimnohabitans innermongolicus]ELY61638.1 hypothetical protein C493_02201 [Natronolimnohabitans innermongolicus JCM 12255]
MKRRSLLAVLGASSVAFAGCLSVDGSVEEGATVEQEQTRETTVDLESGTSQESRSTETPSDPDEPVAEVRLGSTDGDAPSHRVRLWNRTAETRSVDLEIESEASHFEGAYDLASDAHVVVFLSDRATYDVDVAVDGGAADTTTLEEASFDDPCPATELFVEDDGDLEVTTESDADHC